MLCSDCGYTRSDGQADCPRCAYRRHLALTVTAPAPAPCAEAVPVSAPTPTGRAVPPRRRIIALAGVCLSLSVLLLARPALLASHLAQGGDAKTDAQTARASAIFAHADGPCRSGAASCQASIRALHILRDHSDAALLLGDFRISRYFHNQPDRNALQRRWRRDQFSAEELTALGFEARRQHLLVFRSFWMYANIKQNNFAVPTLTINNDPDPF